MKTLKIIVAKIQVIQNRVYDQFLEMDRRKQKRQDKKDLLLLEPVKKYLLSQPSEEYLKTEERRLETLIGNIMDRFVSPDNVSGSELSKLRKIHEKEYDIQKHRKHLKTIRYILY